MFPLVGGPIKVGAVTDPPEKSDKPNEAEAAPNEPTPVEEAVADQNTSSNEPSFKSAGPADPTGPAHQAPESFWTKQSVALAGIAATLITAFFGSYFTYQTSVDAARAAREQSSTEFQRNERIKAYSDLLAKTLSMETIEQDVDRNRYSEPVAQLAPQLLKELDKWGAAVNQLHDAVAAVDLVGSANVRVKTQLLREAHTFVDKVYSDLNAIYLRNPHDQEAINAALNDLDSKRMEALRARQDFLEAARSDLGISFGNL